MHMLDMGNIDDNDQANKCNESSKIKQADTSILMASAAKSQSTIRTSPKGGVQGTMASHAMRLLAGKELENAESCMVEFFVDCKLSFCMADRPSFHRFVDSLRLKASTKLPRHTKMKSLMANCAKKALLEVEEAILCKIAEGYSVGICVDGWENVSKEHLEGVIVYVGEEAFSVKSIKADTEYNGIAVARGWEELLESYKTKYPVSYHCSNDAGQCAHARCILWLQHPHLLWLKCFAHQVNLMVGALLKTIPFHNSGDLAIAAAKNQ